MSRASLGVKLAFCLLILGIDAKRKHRSASDEEMYNDDRPDMSTWILRRNYVDCSSSTQSMSFHVDSTRNAHVVVFMGSLPYYSSHLTGVFTKNKSEKKTVPTAEIFFASHVSKLHDDLSCLEDRQLMDLINHMDDRNNPINWRAAASEMEGYSAYQLALYAKSLGCIYMPRSILKDLKQDKDLAEGYVYNNPDPIFKASQAVTKKAKEAIKAIKERLSAGPIIKKLQSGMKSFKGIFKRKNSNNQQEGGE